MNITDVDISKLLALPYKEHEATLPKLLSFNTVGFARNSITEIKVEFESNFKAKRRDIKKNVDHAFRLIMCNLVVSVFDRKPIALSGANKAYNKSSYFNKKLYLTHDAVNVVLNFLCSKGYILKKLGSKAKKRVNQFTPTSKLETLLLPLIYNVFEEYTDKTKLVILSDGEDSNNREQEHIMWRSSYIELETTYSSDIASLKRINDALKGATYAFKGPVRRIYSKGDPMKGGRLYVQLQSLPDRKARIRINTLLNNEPVAEVDLSANHPRMIMALEKEQLPENFYDEIASFSNTTRDQVKFLVMKMIGANNRAISLALDEDQRDWYNSNFVMNQEERLRIEDAIKNSYPKLSSYFYSGRGVNLQALEGDILLKTMLTLLDQDILSLPIHDAVYVQQRYVEQAKMALENAWMEVLDVSFKPFTKIDKP